MKQEAGFPRHSLIFGFHGTEKSICEDLVLRRKRLQPSENEYDWLGHGMYFWENDPVRAFAFAEEKAKREKRKNWRPAVVGAVMDLGKCLDLLNDGNKAVVTSAYQLLETDLRSAGIAVPVNKANPKTGFSLHRDLDCAVINFVHSDAELRGLEPYDSVRGVFWEGEEIYPTAGFREKNHVQICVRNPACIIGYFLPEPFEWS